MKSDLRVNMPYAGTSIDPARTDKCIGSIYLHD